MKNTALLIIDVQIAMFPKPEEVIPHRDVLDNMKQVLATARLTNTPVIFIQHSGEDEFMKGTPTWQIYHEVKPLNHEVVIEKTKRDSFFNTTLEMELEKLDIKTLVVMGMQTEYCVDTTCRSANNRGYDCILIQDAHSTFDKEYISREQIIMHHNHILNEKVVQLKSTKEVIEILTQIQS